MEVSQKFTSRIIRFKVRVCEDINNLWHNHGNINVGISEERNLDILRM